jgi:hypothetical protein
MQNGKSLRMPVQVAQIPKVLDLGFDSCEQWERQQSQLLKQKTGV